MEKNRCRGALKATHVAYTLNHKDRSGLLKVRNEFAKLLSLVLFLLQIDESTTPDVASRVDVGVLSLWSKVRCVAYYIFTIQGQMCRLFYLYYPRPDVSLILSLRSKARCVTSFIFTIQGEMCRLGNTISVFLFFLFWGGGGEGGGRGGECSEFAWCFKSTFAFHWMCKLTLFMLF